MCALIGRVGCYKASRFFMTGAGRKIEPISTTPLGPNFDFIKLVVIRDAYEGFIPLSSL